MSRLSTLFLLIGLLLGASQVQGRDLVNSPEFTVDRNGHLESGNIITLGKARMCSASLTTLLTKNFTTSCMAVRQDRQALVEMEVDYIYASTDDTVKQRLSQLDASIVEHRFDPVVRRLISRYVERYRSGSERLLGRSAAYFPYFSEQLQERGMPDALKYLTIPESALRPYALSHVGAAGLWQLMPGTARELGLIVDDTLDQRLDLVEGTAAGLDYLTRQYERYEDWALAMAAYNCGPGRVNKAIRRSRSNNFWALRKHLPRETRNYVPAYIAATYLFTYFSAYDLQPLDLDPDLQITERLRIYDFLSLYRVAQVTGLRPRTVMALNPAYLKGFIPASPEGLTLRIPRRTAAAMRQYLKAHHQSEEEPVLSWLSPRLYQGRADGRSLYQEVISYPSAQDTSAQQLSHWLGQPEQQLLIWNSRGPLDSIRSDESWRYWRIEHHQSFGPPQPPVTEIVAALPDLAYRLETPADGSELPDIPMNAPLPPAKTSSLKRFLIRR